MSAVQFKNWLAENTLDDIVIIESNEETRTAADAARVHGVSVRNIVKSILLTSTDQKQHCLCLVPGDKRIDLVRLSKFLGQEYRMATPDEVKSVTGYSIGGVPPFGQVTQCVTYILSGFDVSSDVIPAGGAGNAVFRITYARLVEITKALEIDI